MTEDETTAKGTLEDPTGSKYYVHAVGKDGGAGIGSGGSTYSEDSLSKSDNDFDSTITIKSGAVFAQGGRSFAITSGHDKYNGMYLGAGAGIGGGAGEGTVDEVIINGGFIRAKAGNNHANSDRADDIGSGGDWSVEDPGDRDRSRHLLITDGTVLCDRLGNFTEPLRISGGSVRANTTAYPIDSSLHSYWHSAKLIDNPLTKVDVSTWMAYGSKSIYTDENNKVYLYLEARGNKSSYDQWADITVGGEKRHYYGYTDYNMGQSTSTSNNSMLKMDGGIVSFKEPKDARYGTDFALELDDGTEALKGAAWEFTAKGAASLVGDGKATSPGAKLTLHGNAVGAFTVEGTSSTSVDPEVYWNSTATYVGTTKRAIPSVEIIEDPSKEYDATPVANPIVESNSAGAVTYAYYKDGTKLDSAPKDVGTYTVVATVAETPLFEEGSSEAYEFTISPRVTGCTLEMELDPNDNAVVWLTATVYGLLEADGTVEFNYSYGNHSKLSLTSGKKEVTKLADGVYGVKFKATNLPASTYVVQATYRSGEAGNYQESKSDEQQAYKGYSNRNILDEEHQFQYTATYGDGPIAFTLSTDHPLDGKKDEWDWSGVISDAHDSQFSNHTVSLSSEKTYDTDMPTATINHVGEEVLSVSLGNVRDTHEGLSTYVYNTVYHNVTVSVLPKDLMVTTPSDTKVYDGTPLTAKDGKCEGLVNDETVDFKETAWGSQTDVGSSPNTYEIDWDSNETTAKEANYNEVKSLGTLTVTPRPTTLNLQLTENGTSATATATIEGLLNGDTGTVTFTVAAAGGNPSTYIRDVPKSGNVYSAEVEFNPVSQGDYTVMATFTPGSNNYLPSAVTKTATKTDVAREIKGDRLIKKTYGDAPFSLGLSVEETAGNDSWSYVLESDVAGIDSNGVVTINGVGQAVVRARVQDNTGAYEDAYAYVVIVVEPKDVTVTTESDTRAYDGTALTAGGSCEGLVPDDELVVTGTQTNAGWSRNTYRITPDGSAANYNITESLGILRVTPKRTTVDLVLSQNGSSAKATATIGGFLSEDNVGTVTFFANGNKVGEPASVTRDEGVYTAEITLNDVPASDYAVRAVFTPAQTYSNNYLPSATEVDGHKELAKRTIEGTRAHRKTYGEDGFNLNLSVGSAIGGSDVWSYGIVYDSNNKLDLGPSISVSDAGQVTVNHAGRVVVRATVTDSRDTGQKVYADATAYVVVDIAPAQLTVTSYAFARSDSSKTPVKDVTYGQVGTLSYGLMYTGLVNGDTVDDFTHGHGTLRAVPLVPTIGASETPYPVRIARIGTKGQGDQKREAFFCCNYDIKYDTSTNAVTVGKAPLAIQALDTGGAYGSEPTYAWDVASNQPDFTWEGKPCAGLVSWDTTEQVFTEQPRIELDPEVTDGKAYQELAVGTYGKALIITGGVSQNYGICTIPGTLVIDRARIDDTARFTASVEGTTYTGVAQQQPVTVIDHALGDRSLEQETDYRAIYLGNNVDAGTAYVAVLGTGNYGGAQILGYDIGRAGALIATESAFKIHDGTPLTAPGSVEGIVDADAYDFAVTGSQTDPGISRNTYTLEFANPSKANNYAAEESVGRLVVASNDAADFFVSDVEDYVYDGSEHRQAMTVRNHLLQELVEGEDYTLSYEGDLVNVGTITITITGIGRYEGSTTRTYAITPATLDVNTMSATKVYDGTPLVGDGELHGLVGEETVTLTITGTQTEVGSSPNTYTLTWDGTAREANYEVREFVGTLTVVSPESLYYCSYGDGGTWSRGSVDGLTFVFKRTYDDESTFSHFKGLEVDGEEVGQDAYTAESGSVVIRVQPAYLETLADGTHTLTTQFDDGADATASFTIKPREASAGETLPRTDDPYRWLAGVTLLVGALGIAVGVRSARRS